MQDTRRSFWRRHALVLAFLSSGSARALAQDALVTDRPGVGLSTAVVGQGRFQLEFGLPSLTLVRGDGSDLRAWSTPFLARWGCSADAELRLSGPGWNVVEDEASGSRVDGFGDLELGGKLALAPGSGAAPSLALVAGVRFPTGAEAFSSRQAGYDLTLAAGWNLGGSDSLGATLGVVRLPAGSDYAANGVTSLTLTHALDEHWSVFGELGWFPDLHGTRDQSVWGAGTTLLLSHDVQLDLAGDFALDAAAPDASVGLGISVRF